MAPVALTRAGRRRASPRPIPATPVRIVLVGLLCTVLAVIAGRAFDTVVWELLLAPVIVTAVGVAVHARRTRVRLVALAAGVVVATAFVGLLADATVGELVTSPFTGIKRLLTTEWPSPQDPRIVVTVALLLAVLTSVCVELARRREVHVVPLIAVVVGLAGSMAISAPVRPTVVTMVALTIGALPLLMLRPGDDVRSRTRAMAADRTVLLAVGAIVVAGIVAGGAIAWSDRADPRVTNPAESVQTLLDPVEETVALREAEPQLDLFRIVDRSTLIGESLPARWRLSALDVYDGQRWTPGVTLRPIGSRLGLPSEPRPDLAPPIEFDVELLTDDFDLVPIPGRPLAIDMGSPLGIETDLDRTVVRLADAPSQGLTLTASAEPSPGPETARVATVGTRQIDEIAGGFTETARTIAGDGTVLEQLRALETTMRDDWTLDSEAPGGGQQLTLMNQFVTDTRRGTAEQFVTAFVLMARSLGVNARVATGFVVPPGDLEAPLGLRSTHAAVWPEVELEDRGWMPFDPVPEQEDPGDEPPAQQPSAQSPAAAQPPPDTPTDRAVDDESVTVDPESGTTRWDTVRTWLGRAGIVGGLAVLPFVVVIGTILGLKWRRRRRRLRASDPSQRINGAWANTTDSLVDAGLTIRPAWTNEEIAEQATTVAPAAPHEMRRLAAAATAITFGGDDTSWGRPDDAVSISRTVDLAILADRSRWRRVRWRLSLRSLRRPTRSPVTA